VGTESGIAAKRGNIDNVKSELERLFASKALWQTCCPSEKRRLENSLHSIELM
jgi:hypothetical protein